MLKKQTNLKLVITTAFSVLIVVGLSGCTVTDPSGNNGVVIPPAKVAMSIVEHADWDKLAEVKINGKPYRASAKDSKRGTVWQSPSEYKDSRRADRGGKPHKGFVEDKKTGGFYPVTSTDGKNWVFTTEGLMQRELDKLNAKKKKKQERESVDRKINEPFEVQDNGGGGGD